MLLQFRQTGKEAHFVMGFSCWGHLSRPPLRQSGRSSFGLSVSAQGVLSFLHLDLQRLIDSALRSSARTLVGQVYRVCSLTGWLDWIYPDCIFCTRTVEASERGTKRTRKGRKKKYNISPRCLQFFQRYDLVPRNELYIFNHKLCYSDVRYAASS